MGDLVASWLDAAGAPPQVLAALDRALPGLPRIYLDLLAKGNGGEVALARFPYNFCLDTAEAALDYWESGAYTMDGVFVFGGDGGGELLALDMRAPKPWPVICFDPIDPEQSQETVACDFGALLDLVVHGDGR